jgi:hypothetical protein
MAPTGTPNNVKALARAYGYRLYEVAHAVDILLCLERPQWYTSLVAVLCSVTRAGQRSSFHARRWPTSAFLGCTTAPLQEEL